LRASTEVSELDEAGGRDETRGAGNVTVYETVAMEVGQPRQNLLRVPDRKLLVQGAKAREDGGDAAPVAHFHEQVQVGVAHARALVFDDVEMSKLLQRVHLRNHVLGVGGGAEGVLETRH